MFVISHNNIIFLVGTVVCMGYTFIFNVPHLIISGSIFVINYMTYIDNGFSRYGKQSFFYLMDVPAVEMCERLVKLFLVAIPEHTYIIVQRIGRQKHLLWLICRMRKKLPPMGNHGAAASFVISHFLQSFIYAQVCLKPAQINIFI